MAAPPGHPENLAAIHELHDTVHHYNLDLNPCSYIYSSVKTLLLEARVSCSAGDKFDVLANKRGHIAALYSLRPGLVHRWIYIPRNGAW